MAKVNKKILIPIIAAVTAIILIVGAVFIIPGISGGPAVSPTPEASATPRVTHTPGQTPNETVLPTGTATPTAAPPPATPTPTPIPTVTVSFNSMGGIDVDPIEVIMGGTIAPEDMPVAAREGYIFDDWYVDEALTTEYYATDRIISTDTTLYAGWYERKADEAFEEVYSDGRGSQQIMPEGGVIIESYGLELNNDNWREYISIASKLPQSDKAVPELKIEPLGNDRYFLSAADKWPEGGRYALYFLYPTVAIIPVDKDVAPEDIVGKITLRANNLTLMIDPGEDRFISDTVDDLVIIERADYSAFEDHVLYLNPEAEGKYNLTPGTIVQIMMDGGLFEYQKVKDQNGSEIILETALMEEVYTEFDMVARSEPIFISDYFEQIDKDAILQELSNNPDIQIIQNVATLSAIDYANKNGMSNVEAVVIRDGTVIGNELTLTPMAEIDFDKSELKFEAVIPTWEPLVGINLPDDARALALTVTLHVKIDDDTYAKVKLYVEAFAYFQLEYRGDCEFKKDWPPLELWFDTCVLAELRTAFEFELTLHDNGKIYDASDIMDTFGEADVDTFVKEYQELINLGYDDLRVLDLDIITIKFDFLKVVQLGIPFGIELELTMNGCIDTRVESTVMRYYGISGSIEDGFRAWEDDFYEFTSAVSQYKGNLGVRIGMRVGMEISFLGFTDLGKVGIKAEIGFFHEFWGYGYQGKSGVVIQPEPLKPTYKNPDDIIVGESEHIGLTRGASISERGMYLQFGVYAKSEIFDAKAEAETKPIEFILGRKGNIYWINDKATALMPIGYSEESREKAKETIIVDENGYDLSQLDITGMTYLDLKTGKTLDLDTEIIKRYEFYGGGYVSYWPNLGDVGYLMPRESTVEAGVVRDDEVTITYYHHSMYISENNRSWGFCLSIPVKYVPLEFDESQLGEKRKVELKFNSDVFKTFEIEYGTSLNMYLKENKIDVNSLYTADADFLARHPEYQSITWSFNPDAVVLDNTVYEAKGELKTLYISVGIISEISEINGEQRIVMHTRFEVKPGDNLLEKLNEIELKLHENQTFLGWKYWDTEELVEDDRIITLADDGNIVVFSDYDGKQIRINVTVMALKDPLFGTESMEFTFPSFAGRSIDEVIETLMNDNGVSIKQGDKQAYIMGTGYPLMGEYRYIAYEDLNLIVGWMDYGGDYTVTFDPNGGSFITTPEDELTNGKYSLGMPAGYTFTEDKLSYFAVERARTDSTIYEFGGWYYIDQNGEKQFMMPALDTDITFYAEWKETDRLYDVTIFGSGVCGEDEVSGTVVGEASINRKYTFDQLNRILELIDRGEYMDYVPEATEKKFAFSRWTVQKLDNGSYEFKPVYEEGNITVLIRSDDINGVEGTLDDGNKTKSYTITYDEGLLLEEQIKSGDFSALPVVAPTSNEYVFEDWVLRKTEDKYFEIVPVFRREAKATVTLDMGKGINPNGNTGKETIVFDIPGASLAYSIDKTMEPRLQTSVDAFVGTAVTTVQACYIDEHYYYMFKGWKTSDGNTSWELKHGDSITVTAEYERYPRAFSIVFKIDSNATAKENLLMYDMPYNSSEIRIWGEYGKAWDTSKIPSAMKATDSKYSYTFVDWVCAETGKEGVTNTVEGNRTYTPKFDAKETVEYSGEVTITFDAGTGYFPSTGSRYLTVKVPMGTIFYDLYENIEVPVRSDSRYVFNMWQNDQWDYETDSPSYTCTGSYWNIERNCPEGEEYRIQIIVDAGEGAEFAERGRYWYHPLEEGDSIVEYFGQSDSEIEWELTYFEQFTIYKDGKEYIGILDFSRFGELPLKVTWDIDMAIIPIKEYIPYDEWAANQE